MSLRARLFPAAFLVLTSSLAAQVTVPSAPALRWGPVPGLLPRGAQMALVTGDPFKAAPLVVMLSMPDGYRLPPHFHPAAEQVRVTQGTFLVGMGDRFDLKKTKRLTAGDTTTAPAGMHHYAMAQGPTIVSMSMMGPYVITYVHANDEPWGTFPYGY